MLARSNTGAHGPITRSPTRTGRGRDSARRQRSTPRFAVCRVSRRARPFPRFRVHDDGTLAREDLAGLRLRPPPFPYRPAPRRRPRSHPPACQLPCVQKAPERERPRPEALRRRLVRGERAPSLCGFRRALSRPFTGPPEAGAPEESVFFRTANRPTSVRPWELAGRQSLPIPAAPQHRSLQDSQERDRFRSRRALPGAMAGLRSDVDRADLLGADGRNAEVRTPRCETVPDSQPQVPVGPGVIAHSFVSSVRRDLERFATARQPLPAASPRSKSR